ncbi:hypothetical protein C8R45DRAFT_824329 [Mycena sanguinolenta]|nr:hypothetical protein C8R45DRAFT_824329 [Mycena sanguinolenta]
MILQSSEIATFQHILHTGVSVTDFKLGIEVVQHNSGPSPASGVSVEQYEAACEAQDDSNHDLGIIIWLLEPRQSSRVKHWSGTNEYHPWHQNKLGSRLNAFAHYVYLFSQESTVLADLQSVFFSSFGYHLCVML